MANFVFNVSKGRAAEFATRVKNGDPAAARLYVIPLLATGLETQTALEDSLTYAEVIDGTTDEATAGGWNRKTITAAMLTITTDMVNNRVDVDMDDQTWTAVSASNNTGALVVCFASVASPTDTQLIPMTHHDFVVNTDGSDVTAQINAAGFFRAS